eukprot:CAMPEP_0182465218 /NCGR_PEP_ID=MMETSP1319-20130603/9062_1 /TAXON_ID=172717 /ORGANISM="Bolidomonas pacifica, Strain RCC208" /LENGTH=391 /DNA_ID=CAMNT_0024664911 /DNA_START=24 /DNA_END=1195 /DNA_ORIENTATION=-
MSTAPVTVTVTDPAQQSEGMNKFTSYKVNTVVSSPLPNFPFQTAAVIRRYSDFVWLTTMLHNEYPGAILPPLPEKQAVSRFSPEFVEGRRRMLDRFLQRVTLHPELLNSPSLSTFLSADDTAFSVAKASKSSSSSSSSDGGPSAGKSGGMMKWFNETKTSLSKDLVKTDDDDKFAEIAVYVDTLENQMKTVIKHTQSLVKKGKETANGLYEFGLAFTLLGHSESSSLGAALTQVGHTADSLAVLSAQQAEMENAKFEDPLVDYVRLIASVKAALKQRESKLVSYSAASTDLAAKKAALGKVSGVPGKEDKVAAATALVEAAGAALELEKSTYEATAARCLREVERFKREKADDMKKTVLDYINLQVEFNKRMEETWSKLVPQLEGVSVEEG